MAMNLMKRIVSDGLGLHSRMVQEKPILTIKPAKNTAKFSGNCSLD
jgi:hypothetical protein